MKTQALIAVCLALGGLVWFDNFAGDGAPEQPAVGDAAKARGDGRPNSADQPAATDAASLVRNPLSTIDRQTLSETVNRPLFAPSRSRPPPPVVDAPVETAAAPPEPPPSYALLGVVRNQGRAIALLRRMHDGTSFRVEVGDTIGGWMVASVEPKAVRLERQDGTSRLVQLGEGAKEQRASDVASP